MTYKGPEFGPECRTQKESSMLTTTRRPGLWLGCPWGYADSPIGGGLVIISKGRKTSGFCMKGIFSAMSAGSPVKMGLTSCERV